MKTCRSCSQLGMPAIHPGSQATARRCQLCGHVEELGFSIHDVKLGDGLQKMLDAAVQATEWKSLADVLPPANTQGTADGVGGPQ